MSLLKHRFEQSDELSSPKKISILGSFIQDLAGKLSPNKL